MHEDTIPSQLFPEGDSARPRARSEKPRKVGVIGILIIAILIGLAGMTLAKVIHKFLAFV